MWTAAAAALDRVLWGVFPSSPVGVVVTRELRSGASLVPDSQGKINLTKCNNPSDRSCGLRIRPFGVMVPQISASVEISQRVFCCQRRGIERMALCVGAGNVARSTGTNAYQNLVAYGAQVGLNIQVPKHQQQRRP